MEEDKKEETKTPQTQGTPSTSTGQRLVSTPPPLKKQRKGTRLIPIVLVIVIILGGGLFFLSRRRAGQPEESPTPTAEVLSTPAPTETPEPVDRAEVDIEVLNGTGIAGEAAFLQGKLRDLGYENIDVGNADDQDNETTRVTFSSDLSDVVVEEIKSELEDIYKDVSASTSRSLSLNVQVITGLRKGQTPKPSPTETPTPSPTESPTPSPTSSPSPT